MIEKAKILIECFKYLGLTKEFNILMTIDFCHPKDKVTCDCESKNCQWDKDRCIKRIY